MKMLPEHPLLSQVRGQSPVKRSRGERGCKIAPLPATEAIKRNRNEGQGGERQWDRHKRLTGCKYAAWPKEKSTKKKRERKNGIIKFSFVLTGVILFCRGIKWNGEVKKRKKRNNKPKRNHSLVRLMLLFYLGLQWCKKTTSLPDDDLLHLLQMSAKRGFHRSYCT